LADGVSTQARQGIRSASVTVEGIRSPVIEAGTEGASEAVVFVHGNPGSRTDWQELVEAVGPLARAVAMDMPGFGQADKPRDYSYQVSSYAEFLQGALEELGIRRVHLVVHDFGGPFGLLWGLQHPEQWASLTLIDVGILPGYRWHSMARRWRTPLLGELVQAWIPRWAWRRTMQRSNPKGLPEDFVEKMYDDYDRATRRAVLALYRATPDPAQAASTLGPELAKLKVPTLVLWGARDQFAGAEYAERQREFFDVKDVVVLPDSGHWPFKDDPAAVERPLLAFLRAQLGLPAAGA
jgi:pimeloyl-ACP methyl ester carboxylesterase